MSLHFSTHLDACIAGLPSLKSLTPRVEAAVALLSSALTNNTPVLVCGNGGSAADAQHISGELVGKFLLERRAFNVRALSCDTSILTAWANDVNYDTVFSRQAEAYGQAGGVLWAISTSGNSKNVIEAAKTAKQMGLSVLGMTGQTGGDLAPLCDVLLNAPSMSTPRIQEMHQILYHYVCQEIESSLASTSQ